MKEFFRRFNWLQFVSMSALIAIGAFALATAGAARGSASLATKWQSMLVTAAFGYVLYFVLAVCDYRRLLALFAYPVYIVAVAALIAVLVAGTEQFGARRWLWFFQPSEFAKLAVIAAFAQFFGPAEELFRGQRGFRGFLFAAVMVAVPCALILLEPDLGTTLALAPAVTAMLLAAGVWRRGVLTLLTIAALAAGAVLGAVGAAERPGVPPETRAKILRFVPLREHQIKRVKTFIAPEEDVRGDGYNLAQAKMTIGAGGMSGKGYGRGEAIRRGLLPPMGIMNDFIFCVWAEEMGYLRGTLPLLALFALLCLSTAWTAVQCSDGRGRLLALGTATLILAHVYVNIGMSVGLVPITGLPLPFISLGRTFLLTAMCALGLVQSAAVHGEDN